MAVLSKKLFATTIGPVGQAELQQREWHTDTTAHGVFYGIRGGGISLGGSNSLNAKWKLHSMTNMSSEESSVSVEGEGVTARASKAASSAFLFRVAALVDAVRRDCSAIDPT